MTTKNNAEICSRFFCEKCDYKTNKKSSYDNHILSIKHNSTTPLLLIMLQTLMIEYSNSRLFKKLIRPFRKLIRLL